MCLAPWSEAKGCECKDEGDRKEANKVKSEGKGKKGKGKKAKEIRKCVLMNPWKIQFFK